MREYTWDEFDLAIDIISLEILQSGKQIKVITGLPRGGLIPAVCLSHKLGVPYAPYHLYLNDITIPRNRILIVDDIVDSGDTLAQIIEGGYLTASIHYKLNASHVPTFYGELLKNNDWIIYPWEHK